MVPDVGAPTAATPCLAGDPGLSCAWHLHAIEVYKAWKHTRGVPESKIALAPRPLRSLAILVPRSARTAPRRSALLTRLTWGQDKTEPDVEVGPGVRVVPVAKR